MDKVSKVEKIEGKEVGDTNVQNPFLCKAKPNEGCDKCNHSGNHSVGDAAVFERGTPSKDIFTLLFERPHSLGSIEKIKKRMEECFIPDCGSAFFLSEADARRAKEEFASLSDIEANACFVVKLSLVGCDDLAPEDTLRIILGGINRLSFLQNHIVELLVRKRGAKCVHYLPTEHACRDCGIMAGKNKREEQVVYRGGNISSQYTKLEKEPPPCLELEF